MAIAVWPLGNRI